MVGQNKDNYEHSQHAVFFKAREIAWIILAQAPRRMWPWEGAKEGAVVAEEDSWVKWSELCDADVCEGWERWQSRGRWGHDLCWEHREQADLTEDEGWWRGAAAGRGRFDGNSCYVCTDTLLALHPGN